MTRFDELKADLGIADNILSARLGRLVDADHSLGLRASHRRRPDL
jgi:DNA-binding HxlR family transcriptional regulator